MPTSSQSPTSGFTLTSGFTFSNTPANCRAQDSANREIANARCRSTERFDRKISTTGDVLLDLAIAQEQLDSVRLENERLKASNALLTQAADDASPQGMETRHPAHHDHLTGLPNRLLLLRRLQDAITDAFQRQGQLALMFIDIDGFNVLENRFGRAAGDKLLMVVANRIAACVRRDDVTCRYGDDEFVVMLANIGDTALAIGLAEEIRARIDGRYWIDGREVEISTSVGLSLYPADGAHCDALLGSAEASLVRNRARRGSTVEDACDTGAEPHNRQLDAACNALLGIDR